MPAAPARFSTTMGCPSNRPSGSWITRIIASCVPPGGYGTTMRSGRLADCARAAPGTAAAASSPFRIERRAVF